MTEALKCLKDFIPKANTALEELHEFVYAHLDVRLQTSVFHVIME